MREAIRGHQGSSGVISRHLAAEDCMYVRLVDNGLVATAHVHRRVRRAKRCRRLSRRTHECRVLPHEGGNEHAISLSRCMHECRVVPDERLIASGSHAVREKAPYRRQSEAIRGPPEAHQRAIRGPSAGHQRGPEGRLVMDSAYAISLYISSAISSGNGHVQKRQQVTRSRPTSLPAWSRTQTSRDQRGMPRLR